MHVNEDVRISFLFAFSVYFLSIVVSSVVSTGAIDCL